MAGLVTVGSSKGTDKQHSDEREREQGQNADAMDMK